MKIALTQDVKVIRDVSFLNCGAQNSDSKSSRISAAKQVFDSVNQHVPTQSFQAQNMWCMRQLVYMENCMGKSPIVKEIA